ncbi:MAG: SpoIIE family protein phosphatase [Pyrinomonadaceae bacterium]|nr:SpoIIE family protein phosphatase [Phycisphaerales bacterium]
MSTEQEPITLQTLAGPYAGAFVVAPDHPATLGRAASSDICLLHEGVSRRHATIVRRISGWYVLDHGSIRGTYLNGVRLEASKPTELGAGDLLGVGPWTFRIISGRHSAGATTGGASTIDDSTSRTHRVERVGAGDLMGSTDRRLRLLTECITRLDAAKDEQSLAMAALQSGLSGSGYARGAVLKRINGGHEVEVVASMRLHQGDQSDFAFSGSLVAQAAAGSVAILTSEDSHLPRDYGQSVAELRIHSALCAPIFLGDAVEGFLYLDARGQESSVRPDATGFCEAVARSYGLAVANLKRVDLERRQTSLHEQLSAAREAQQFILPPPEGSVGFLSYAMEMRAGLFVAGDLFDIIPIDETKVAVCMGDVAGHGVASALLMAMTQASLNGQIRAHSDIAKAVHAVNKYVTERSGAGRFVSLWIGVFHADGTLAFVDAGHGHWVHVHNNICMAPPRGRGGGIPLGIVPEYEYQTQTIHLTPGDRVVLYSDGMIEQRSATGEEFSSKRLGELIVGASTARDVVGRCFDSLTAFAGSASLADDATVAVIEFDAHPRATSE